MSFRALKLVTFILQPKIPHTTIPYINNVPVQGPALQYIQQDGTHKMHINNPDIQKFVWVHFQGFNRVVQRMKYSGGTFLGYKVILCTEEIMVVGHHCTIEGQLFKESHIAKIINWGPCKDLSDIQAFLGTIRVVQIFIYNFAHCAHHLNILTHKDYSFIFGLEQHEAQEDLKQAPLLSTALRPLNYTLSSPVIYAVDTLYIVIGFHLCQCDPNTLHKRYYVHFGSITLNDCEGQFLQPKLELYGLFQAM